MPAGGPTTANNTGIWSDLSKLSPMVWMQGAQAAVAATQQVMDLVDQDPDAVPNELHGPSVTGRSRNRSRRLQLRRGRLRVRRVPDAR